MGGVQANTHNSMSGSITSAAVDTPLVARHADPELWRFSVSIDGASVGFHEYELTPMKKGLEVRSEADFKYSILFVRLLRYSHENKEIWEGSCLREISSRTRMNRKLYSVEGQRAPENFVVETGSDSVEMPGCVRSFAYWDKHAIKSDALLNAQTGKLEDVAVSFKGTKSVASEAAGTVEADVYQIKAESGVIEVWYEKETQLWLGLESQTKEGRTIRYEAVQLPKS